MQYVIVHENGHISPLNAAMSAAHRTAAAASGSSSGSGQPATLAARHPTRLTSSGQIATLLSRDQVRGREAGERDRVGEDEGPTQPKLMRLNAHDLQV